MVGVAAFVVYGSLLPFDLHWLSLGQAWGAYLGFGSDSNVRLSLTDFATNFLLFAPLAFCLQGCLRAGRSGLGAALLVVTGCAGIALGKFRDHPRSRRRQVRHVFRAQERESYARPVFRCDYSAFITHWAA